jgi:ethanolamine utilization microcompartment shell protein EutS
MPAAATFLDSNIVTRMGDYRRGFGSDIGFINHFNTQLVITLNDSAISDLHTLQITVTHTLMFSVCY